MNRKGPLSVLEEEETGRGSPWARMKGCVVLVGLCFARKRKGKKGSKQSRSDADRTDEQEKKRRNRYQRGGWS